MPVAAGLSGAVLGAGMTGTLAAGADLDSHIRYLSGLLLGIGLAFWSSIPTIERRTAWVRLLTGIVVVGGLARLLGFALHGMPGLPMRLAIVMELVVTPAICLWQTRVAAAPLPLKKASRALTSRGALRPPSTRSCRFAGPSPW